MTRESINAAWKYSRAPKKARLFVLHVAAHDPAPDDFKYLVGHMTDKKAPEWNEEFYAIRKIGIQSPMTYPYFFVKTDAELMHVRLLISKMVAYEVTTGKKVIR